MEAARPPHSEMVRPENRYILGTFNPKTIRCANYSIARARWLKIPEKEESVLDYLLSCAGLDGRAREDLRDAVAGRQAQTPGLGGPPITSNGTRGGTASW